MPDTTRSIRGFELWVGLLLLTDLFTGSFATPTVFEALGGPSIDYAHALTETMDGGLALAGTTFSFGAGGSDAILAKFDTNGTLLFARTLGGSKSEYTNAVAETIDGGLAMAGYTDSFGAGGFDAFLAKFDANGTLIFARTLGGPVDDRANALIETSDGGLAMVGFTWSFGAGGADAFLAKFDMNGGLIFALALGGPGDDLAHALTETIDGGLAMAGNTASFGVGGNDGFLAKFDANGTLIFARTMGGPSGDYANALVETMDGGLAMTGHTQSFGAGTAAAFLAKFDDNGTLLFARTIGDQKFDNAYALTETEGGGLAMTGYTASFGSGSTDAFLAKFDANGTLLFARTLGGSSNDYAVALIETMDGGLAMAGYTSSFGAGVFDAFLAKWSDEGTLSNCSYVGYITATAGDANATVTSISPNTTAFSPSVNSIVPNVAIINPQTVTICPQQSPSLASPTAAPSKASPTTAPTSMPVVPSPVTLPVPPTPTTTAAATDVSLVIIIASAASLVVCALAVVCGIALLRYHTRRRQHKANRRFSVRPASSMVPSSVRNSRRSSLQLRASGASHSRKISQALKTRPQEQQYATAPAIDSPYALAPTMDSFAD